MAAPCIIFWRETQGCPAGPWLCVTRGALACLRRRELGCSDFSVAALNLEGAKVRSYRVALLTPSSEPKTLAESFPALKLGGKKPPGAK